jgi:hypothetical protein
VHRHVGLVGAGAVLAERVDDCVLVVAGGAQGVAERRSCGPIGDRIERLAAQRKAS